MSWPILLMLSSVGSTKYTSWRSRLKNRMTQKLSFEDGHSEIRCQSVSDQTCCTLLKCCAAFTRKLKKAAADTGYLRLILHAPTCLHISTYASHTPAYGQLSSVQSGSIGPAPGSLEFLKVMMRL